MGSRFTFLNRVPRLLVAGWIGFWLRMTNLVGRMECFREQFLNSCPIIYLSCWHQDPFLVDRVRLRFSMHGASHWSFAHW